ncbi:hypothetical protein KO353_04000 [Elioraea tepida]|jgi:hypothetical protein|uniref:Uncharacterized protein n=1 Tax=Elioraea tepida TaxID=2843330 RepID=A0A975U3P8_9PROT|nr:hypothetical protein [Elioraea tepida]QXM25407.1 hypothetical protein KO353_04000 [Elioraea tepida]
METPESGEGGAAAITAALGRLADALALARVLVQSGLAVDLSGLDREVGDLCAEAVALPRAEGREMATPLADLLAQIDDLERAMERYPPLR